VGSGPAIPCNSPLPGVPSDVGRWVIDERFASLVASFGASFPSLDLVRDAGVRADNPALHAGVRIASFHCATPARCGALVDERRVVAGDTGASNARLEPFQVVYAQIARRAA
jgi:hypothetical protein